MGGKCGIEISQRVYYVISRNMENFNKKSSYVWNVSKFELKYPIYDVCCVLMNSNTVVPYILIVAACNNQYSNEILHWKIPISAIIGFENTMFLFLNQNKVKNTIKYLYFLLSNFYFCFYFFFVCIFNILLWLLCESECPHKINKI